MTFHPWTDREIEGAKRILAKHEDIGDAIEEISATVRRCNYESVRGAFRVRELGALRDYLARPLETERQHLRESVDVLSRDTERPEPSGDAEWLPAPVDVRPVTASKPANDAMRDLVALAKRGPLSLEELCDKLDMSPGKARRLVEEAQRTGYTVEIHHDQITWRMPPPNETVIETGGIAPVVGKTFWAGVISDTHLGSKYCMRAQIIDHVKWCYEMGARDILHPGDVVDGIYEHGIYEVSHSGLEAQTEDLFETLPQLPGLRYHCIGGNHDDTASDAVGIDAGQYIQNYFQSRGREDVRFYGRRSAFLRIGGIVVHLWHPKGSCGLSPAHPLTKKINSYPVGAKPHVLLVGHYHTTAYVEKRGVHAIACPTFQAPGSAFGNSLATDCVTGGNLLGWDVTEHGTIRNFHFIPRRYFVVERHQDAA